MTETLHDRITAISDRMENWWLRGDQKHPVLLFTTPPPSHTGLPETDDLETWWMDPDFTLRYAMAVMEAQAYAGSAVPYHYVHLGAGSMAPFLGAHVQLVDRTRCDVHPCFEHIEQIADLTFDPANRYYRAVCRLIEASARASHHHHFVAPFTLGGLADTASALYGPEQLVLDMMESPARVRRAFGRLRQLWMEFFQEFQRLIALGQNPGGISRLGVWAPGSTLCLREDSARLLSTDAFRQFCLPAIVDMLSVTDWPSFLLTPKSLRHLDTLLELTDLHVFQWQPPPGRERLACWYPLIRHILSQGRALQLTAQADEVDDLVRSVGPRGLLVVVRDASGTEAEELLERFSEE